MKKIVIGATGYIGNSLFKRASESSRVCGTSSRKDGSGFVYLSLNEPEFFIAEHIARDDVVFVTAAISSPDICEREPERAWSVNVTGTSTLIQGAIERGARVIFFSSDAVYGAKAERFDEQSVCNPIGKYAEMKHEVERRFSASRAFKTIRISYVFSRDDKFTRYLVGCVRSRDEADLFDPFHRAVIYRDDVIAGALALSDAWEQTPEQVINFGGPQVLSRIDFAECLRGVHLRDLRFRVSRPNEEFFNSRPPVIAMASPILERLLGRPPLNLLESASIEFGSVNKLGTAS